MQYNVCMHEVRIALITSILSLSILASISALAVPTTSSEGVLKTTFLDVGQGDATFIESPSGVQVLIDGGKNARVLESLEKEMGYFDTDIDMVIATHPDGDHIGGLVDVLQHYTIHTIVLTENVSDTPVYEAFMRAVNAEGADIRYARKGQVYSLGIGTSGTTTLHILFPDYDPTHLESNTSSIVSVLRYGLVEYVLTGDSPKQIEEYLVEKYPHALDAEVLKVGHHGSRTSSSEMFVSAVSPLYAIISSGKDNSYGHPHKEVIDIFTAQDIPLLNTAEEGSIETYTDGREIWFE